MRSILDKKSGPAQLTEQRETAGRERRMKYQLWRHYYYHESGCDVYINQAQT